MKDFGDILDRWDNQKKKGMDGWLEEYPPDNEGARRDRIDDHPSREAAQRRRQLRYMEPQRSLDLHGLKADEALRSAEEFLRSCHGEGIRKVLIIHGKGLHSKNEPVLGKRIRERVQRLSFTGEVGVAENRWGGRGALWVILR